MLYLQMKIHICSLAAYTHALVKRKRFSLILLLQYLFEHILVHAQIYFCTHTHITYWHAFKIKVHLRKDAKRKYSCFLLTKGNESAKVTKKLDAKCFLRCMSLCVTHLHKKKKIPTTGSLLS